MPIEVTMPKLSPTMESGVITQWMVKVGDKVQEGDVLADVETDKATMQMKAYDEGVVAHLDYNVGDEVALGARVLVLAKKGEDPKQVVGSLGGKKDGAATPADDDAGPDADDDAGPDADADDDAGADAKPSEPVAEEEEESAPAAPERPAAPSNGQEARPAAAVSEDAGAEDGQGAVAAGGRVKSSPLARKVAAAAEVDLGRIKGSGPGGRVIRSDVEAFLETRDRSPRQAARPAAAAPGAPARAAERVPHTRMRKTIAGRMIEAKKAAPEIHVTVDIRVDALVAVRERLNQQLAADKIKLSIGDFVTKAVALALRGHPGVNASFEPDAIVLHGAVNIGIAVALDGGLIVPVLKDADQLGLREIRVQSEALVAAARGNKLSPEQMGGGTFTISNLGMYGVRQFDAILNLPEVGILAVAAAEKRPVAVDDTLTVGTVMTVTLTADHRAVDGAMAAEFLRTLKGLLEEPASMLL